MPKQLLILKNGLTTILKVNSETKKRHQTTATLLQSYPTAYAKICPEPCKEIQVIGCGIASEVFNFVRESLSQKDILPSDPAVAKVPYLGWKHISLTLKNYRIEREKRTSFPARNILFNPNEIPNLFLPEFSKTC